MLEDTGGADGDEGRGERHRRPPGQAGASLLLRNMQTFWWQRRKQYATDFRMQSFSIAPNALKPDRPIVPIRFRSYPTCLRVSSWPYRPIGLVQDGRALWLLAPDPHATLDRLPQHIGRGFDQQPPHSTLAQFCVTHDPRTARVDWGPVREFGRG